MDPLVENGQSAVGTATKDARGRRNVEALLGANLGRPEQVALDPVGIGKPDSLVVVRDLDDLGLLNRHCENMLCVELGILV